METRTEHTDDAALWSLGKLSKRELIKAFPSLPTHLHVICLRLPCLDFNYPEMIGDFYPYMRDTNPCIDLKKNATAEK
jgi:hypothetical protein